MSSNEQTAERLSGEEFEDVLNTLLANIDAKTPDEERRALSARRALRADRLATTRLMSRRGIERMALESENAKLRVALEIVLVQFGPYRDGDGAAKLHAVNIGREALGEEGAKP